MGFEIKENVLIKYIEEDGITEVVVTKGVTSIGRGAFRGCKNLKHVTLPESVEAIEDDAFRECESLETINFPKGLKTIEKWAFYKCKNLRELNFPEGLTHIGNFAFGNCYSLKHLVIPAKVEYIYWETFGECSDLETVRLLGRPEFEWGSHKPILFPRCHKLTKVIYKDLGINWGFVRYYKENLNNVFTMLDEQDFSIKVGSMIKYRVAVDDYLQTGHTAAGEFVKKNILKIIRDFIDHQDVDRISKLLENTEFITKKNIDKMIEYAMEKAEIGKEEIQTMLTDYKNANFM